ncbi:MAG: Pseudouridine synthase, partial [Halothiobacillaceae bacterium]
MTIKGERLQKVLARAGYGSRREIESWITSHRITINNRPAKLGDHATLEDVIALDGKKIAIAPKPGDNANKVLLYHKPEGELCTRSDPEGRATIFDHLPVLKTGRWITVGRLDINTSGLLLLTTDGDLAHRLMHPSTEIEREYAVRVLGDVDKTVIKALTEGVMLEDGKAHFDSVTEGGGAGANKWFNVILKEGRKREVRRLWEAVGCTVTRLIRIRFGDLLLPRSVRIGRWEYLDEVQQRQLYTLAGLVSDVAPPPRT